jgi:Hypothetical protein (DUF2513)
MTRNWTIIREILLCLEAAPTPTTYLNARDLTDFPEQEVAYNMRLLLEADCINAKIKESSTGNNLIALAQATRLTNLGHDLLDTIRNETVWNKIQDTFKSNGIDMTIDLVLSVGRKIIETLLT